MSNEAGTSRPDFTDLVQLTSVGKQLLPVESKNSAEVILSTVVAAEWSSTFQLKIDNVWLGKLRKSTPRLSGSPPDLCVRSCWVYGIARTRS